MSNIHSLKATDPQSLEDESRKLTIRHKHEITYHLRDSKYWSGKSLYLKFTNYGDGCGGTWSVMEEAGLGQPLTHKWTTVRSKIGKRFKKFPFVAQVTVVSTTTVNKVRS